MAEFRLTDEQRQYRDLARDFAANEIAPRAARHDESGELPVDICRNAWQLGLMNLRVPESASGLGLSLFETCLIAEEIGAACTGIGGIIEASGAAQEPLLVAGSEEQQKRFLQPLMEEPGFAAQVGGNPCPAPGCRPVQARQYADEFVLSGSMPWVANGTLASWFCVFAATGGEGGGLSAFVVPRETAGVHVSERQSGLGRRAADYASVSFEEVRVEKSLLIGGEGEGEKILAAARAQAEPVSAAMAVGLARSAMELSIQYAKERHTFGQAIAGHQAVSFMLADMARDIEAGRLLAWQAAYLADRAGPSMARSSMSLSFAGELAMRAACDAVQIFGGYGYSREYRVEKLMRDAKMAQILSGRPDERRVSVARQLAGIGH